MRQMSVLPFVSICFQVLVIKASMFGRTVASDRRYPIAERSLPCWLSYSQSGATAFPETGEITPDIFC